jgi:hypothetical protein
MDKDVVNKLDYVFPVLSTCFPKTRKISQLRIEFYFAYENIGQARSMLERAQKYNFLKRN